jgi:stearoyl-CoA desaturase (Delta-9 desaturase)
MLAIGIFIVLHWTLAVFCQTFFLHRYGAHRQFTMSKGWERFFYLGTFVTQGASFLSPRAYAIMHREHHAYSDTAKDPHSPYVAKTPYHLLQAMWSRYAALRYRTVEPEPRFLGGYPEWPALDRWAHSWALSIGWGTVYTLFYLYFAPNWAFFLLLPIHYLIGPLQGLIVNWCGHKYGYRNYDTGDTDRSRNTLIFDFVTLGELFQNNHHVYSQAPNFAVRWFELDPAWIAIRLFSWLGIIDIGTPQRARWPQAA